MLILKISVKENNGSNDVQTLILGTYKSLTLHGKRDFTDMIKVKDLEIRGLSWNIWVDPI